MYLNVYYDRRQNTMHLWDDERGYSKSKYQPYCYLISDKSEARYKSLFGDKLQKMEFNTIREMKDFKENWGESVFESDLKPEIRFLIDKYYKEDRSLPEAHVGFFDIELDIGREPSGFPDVKAAKFPINAVTVYSTKFKTYFVMAVKPDADARVKPFGKDVNLMLFDKESELLQSFMKLLTTLDLNIITGWNTEKFDIPYIFNRIANVLGETAVRGLSKIGVVDWDNQYDRYTIAGTDCLDYMVLYKRFELNEKPSYSLNAVALDELGEGKLEYDGWLGALYYDDFEKFIKYNVHDVRQNVRIDEVKGYIDLARSVCYKGNVPVASIVYTSVPLDGAILSFLKNQGMVAPDGRHQQRGGTIKGGFVMDPIIGMHEWVVDFDFTRLYPSLIQTLNISPETKVQKYPNAALALMDGAVNVAANGCVYSTEKRGVIPSILDIWVNERDEYKDLMKKYMKLAHAEKDEATKKELELLENRYDNFQKAVKVFMNALYGIMVLPSFRFHDNDNAEAITLSGQAAIKYAAKSTNELLKKFGSTGKVLAMDTDSEFVSLKGILVKLGIDPNDDARCKEVINKQILPAFTQWLDATMDRFVKEEMAHEGKHHLSLKQELIIRRIFFVAKKRYGALVINKEGVDIHKHDYKGIDIVRSSFPPYYKEGLKAIYGAILDGKTQDEIQEIYQEYDHGSKDEELERIATPTGVKELKPLGTKSIPIHQRASGVLNKFLEENPGTTSSKVRPGSKIQWVYLQTPNPWQSDVIAINEDTSKELKDMITKFIDIEKITANNLQNKVLPVFEACGIQMPEKCAPEFEAFFEFD